MNTVKFFTALIFLAAVSTGFAQGAVDAIRITQDETGFGARALAMGGAYTALADDYSAIYWNPAGLASIRKTQVFGEVSHLNFNNNASFYQFVTDETRNYTRLGSLGLAVAVPTTRGSFTVALGYNRVKDFDQNLVFSGFNPRSNGLGFVFDNTEYLFDRDVYQTEQITEEGGLNQWSLGAGAAMSPNVTAGISAVIWDGKSDYQFHFFQEDRDDIYNQFPGDFYSYTLTRTILADYSAVGFKVGGMFKVLKGMKLGAAVGLPVTFKIKENYQQSDLLVFDNGDEDPLEGDPGVFEYKVKTPFYLDGGISISAGGFLTLSGSARYRDWSQTKFDVGDDLLTHPDYAGLLDENRVIRQDYRETIQYNLGGELFVPGLRMMLRGGYALYPSPLKNAAEDLDKQYYTAGAGFLIDRYVSLNFTYLRGIWKQESTDEFTPGGTLEEITSNKVLIGMTYRF